MSRQIMVFLVPQFNLLVRDPVTKEIIGPKGELKPLFGRDGRYWRRRINDGSVKIQNPKNKIYKNKINKTISNIKKEK